jgi:hypothetical protein
MWLEAQTAWQMPVYCNTHTFEVLILKGAAVDAFPSSTLKWSISIHSDTIVTISTFNDRTTFGDPVMNAHQTKN